MNFLAKHFFDYQSIINLPHHALQMHKTPPSQAGSDPSAAWAPKDLHVAGKNQAAPAARANRNYHGDQRTGSHRHGRPSKLEFRNWGERHGELRPEKIVPHKDHWMETLEIGGGGANAVAAIHRSSFDSTFSDGGGENLLPNEHFTRVLHLMQQQQHQLQKDMALTMTAQQQQEDALSAEEMALLLTRPIACHKTPIRVLLILTLSPHIDFITVTVKSARGLTPNAIDPIVQLRLFDGNRLMEERGTAAAAQHRTQQATIDLQSSEEGQEERELGQSFLLKAPAPLRLPFCHLMISLYASIVGIAPPRTSSSAAAATSSTSAISNGIPPAQQQQQRHHAKHEQRQNSRVAQKQQFLLGTCSIGPSGTVSRTNSHWRQMIKKMGIPIAMWHDLMVLNNNHQYNEQQHENTSGSPPPRGTSVSMLTKELKPYHHHQTGTTVNESNAQKDEGKMSKHNR